MSEVVLKGITWNHSRALPPLVAAAQRYEEMHPGVRVEWQKRTLHEFGHANLAMLAQRFDLLVIDHPMVGDAEATGAIVDLQPLLSGEQFTDFAEDAMGASFSSYQYKGRLYALPIDSAAPAASFRADLMEQHGLAVPTLWGDLLSLARAGHVRMPGFAPDLFLNFMGICVSLGSEVATDPDFLVNEEQGVAALDLLAELASHMPDTIYEMNPIAIYEQMADGDDSLYCPFAYSYSNYSRAGFGKRALRFANPVALDEHTPLRTVLGGTGIAISSICRDPKSALDFVLYVSGRSCQSTLYGVCGGQPARASAWEDPLLNEMTDGFFRRTRQSLEAAYVRPRYRGYTALQETAGARVVSHCRAGGRAQQALEKIHELYRSSRRKASQNV